MAKFFFQGDIPASKSIFNRALIVKSYFPVLEVKGFSACDDVRYMREGIQKIRQHSHIDCGEGGTTFRFLALRTSRQPGIHTLKATERLMSRPQQGLIDILQQLGVNTKTNSKELFLASEGWKKPKKPLKVNISESSQYASSLVLNSWLLNFDLEFELVGEKVSESYFQLTLDMAQEMGLRYQKTANGFLIPAGQRLSKLDWSVEPDLSSAFTMAAAGALAGEAVITNFPLKSAQPDFIFLEVLKTMHVHLEQQGNHLKVSNSSFLKSLDWNLSQCPDLFPVLAVLCSWAHGVSRLHGAPHLAKKESNRIAKVSELLKLIAIEHEVREDGMIIHGNPQQALIKGQVFNPDKDHRMVMAAMLMKLKGHELKVLEPQAVDKSFPEFWKMIGIQP